MIRRMYEYLYYVYVYVSVCKFINTCPRVSGITSYTLPACVLICMNIFCMHVRVHKLHTTMFGLSFSSVHGFGHVLHPFVGWIGPLRM